MASVQFSDVQARPTEFLDLTSLTLDEFQQLVPPFEAAFQAHMAMWRLDGKPRTARQFAVYKNCPLPTPEDRLFFLLTYLKTYALQVVQGRLFGMGQSKASQRPPAKPEACKSGNRSKRIEAVNRSKRFVCEPPTGGTPYHKSIWSNRRSSASCVRMYSRIVASSLPTVET